LRRVQTVHTKRPSQFAELARLLRRLDDPESVRRSPLVRGAFGTPQAGIAAVNENLTLLRIRAAVLSAVATLDTDLNTHNVHFARQRVIVTRCDLRGEKHAAVAADLGVSLREFYRERRRAFERLLANLESNLCESQQPVRALPTRFELDLDRVANFRLVGAFGAAFALLERIANEATNPSDGVRAWCYGVEIASDIGDNERARRLFARALQDARGMADGLEPIGEVNLQMASAYVAWNAGSDLAGASLHLERAAEVAERLPPTIERDHVRAAAGALFHRAELSCLRGDPAAALHTLGYVRRLLDRLPYKPSELLGRLFLELSVVHALVVGSMPRSVEYALEALDVFEFERHAEGIAVASSLLCVALTECGEFEPAFALGTTALETARTAANPKVVADCALVLAQAHAFGGDPRISLTLAREAATLGKTALFAVRAPLAMAEAHLALGDPERALAYAGEAARYATKRAIERYSGTAARIAADAYAALNMPLQAREQADLALCLLSAHGHPYSLARAYATAQSVGIGGPALRLAREIRETLRAPDSRAQLAARRSAARPS
jgi:tetratricopeptide (TPR) repeat protein